MADRIQSLAARYRSLPLVLLAGVCALSLAARVAWLGSPCRSPCGSASDHVLIFDESYYVNAARVIAGLQPPAGEHYAGSPAGVDPNSEHPQLAKVIIAGSIELFGDGPLAWRLGSIILGTLAIVGMFVLVRSAGGGPWLALGAAALIASDNLLLVHSRIATLDIYATAPMIFAAALYLRGRPLLAGALIGVAACAKEVAPYALLVFALFEGLRLVRAPARLRAAVKRLGMCLVAAAGVFLALLSVLGRVAPPYDPVAGKRVGGGALGQVGHMLSYAARQTSPHGPRGIASYPWQWLFDYKPITYLNINPARPADGLFNVHPEAHFLGLISPPILLLAIPALIVAALGALRRTGRPVDEVELIGLAWCVGTFVPFVVLSLIWNRTSYLYYMVIVMPGIYLLVAKLVARLRPRYTLIAIWAAAVFAAAVVMYPFTPLP
jgi:predicted membrane-bound dolichyl-phosphate-mannose-protein mannosyltransferase